MVSRRIIIDTEEHAKDFDALIATLPYAKSIRVLTAEDVALGKGAPYTEEELDFFLTADETDKQSISMEDAVKYLSAKFKSE